MKTTSLSVATKKHISNQTSFKVRGYQCFRSDRIGRSNGGILTLVRNEEGFSYEVVEDHYYVVGDFNGHSQSWGYDHIDKRGEEVEN